jgi:hypothetical protein
VDEGHRISKTHALQIQEVAGTKFNQETVNSEQTPARFSRCKFKLFMPIDVTVKHKHNITNNSEHYSKHGEAG